MVFSVTLTDLLDLASPRISAAAAERGHNSRLIQLAADAGYHAAAVNGGVEIDALAEWTAELNRLAWQAGITLRELRATSADLEQAFLAMTGAGRKGAE